MSAAEQKISELVLDTIAAMPVAQRIGYLHALARVCSSDELVVKLTALACDLEEIEAKHRQLVLDFKRRSGA